MTRSCSPRPANRQKTVTHMMIHTTLLKNLSVPFLVSHFAWRPEQSCFRVGHYISCLWHCPTIALWILLHTLDMQKHNKTEISRSCNYDQRKNQFNAFPLHVDAKNTNRCSHSREKVNKLLFRKKHARQKGMFAGMEQDCKRRKSGYSVPEKIIGQVSPLLLYLNSAPLAWSGNKHK